MYWDVHFPYLFSLDGPNMRISNIRTSGLARGLKYNTRHFLNYIRRPELYVPNYFYRKVRQGKNARGRNGLLIITNIVHHIFHFCAGNCNEIPTGTGQNQVMSPYHFYFSYRYHNETYQVLFVILRLSNHTDDYIEMLIVIIYFPLYHYFHVNEHK